MSLAIKTDNSSLLIFSNSSAIKNQIQSRWFDAAYWRQQKGVSGESKGRHTTWFIDPSNEPSINIAEHPSNQQWVLRHYYRGGLIAKLITDSFLFAGIKRTRAYREVLLLQKMKKLKLPVPEVIGARVTKKGLLYSADLLMEKIEAPDLVAVIKKESLSNKTWNEIGQVIAKFHKNGIYHADLNSHNILIGENSDSAEVWLIDFDRCEQRTIEKSNYELNEDEHRNSWQEKNLARLYRSFIKEKNIFSDLKFNEDNWSELLKGYNAIVSVS